MARSFNGTSDRLVTASNSLAITGGITLIAWIYQDALVAGNKDVIYKNSNTTTNYINNWCMRVTASGKLQFNFYYTTGAIFPAYQTSSVELSATTWSHYLIRHTFGDNTQAEIRLDGSARTATWTVGTGDEAPTTGTGTHTIGVTQQGGGAGEANYWNGDIYYTVVHNARLTDNQCNALARGVNPFVIGDTSLQIMAPLDGNNSPESNYGTPTLTYTLDGTAKGTPNPPVEHLENYI